WTIGLISKATAEVNKNFKFTAGIDWRTAEIEHYREVRDLLGGDYYLDLDRSGNPLSDFWTMEDAKRRLGDRINYDFTNNVNWIGFFGQGEYIKEGVSLYGMAGYSQIRYRHTNRFIDDGTGNPLVVESDWISGFQVKGGASYMLTGNLQAYANLGWVSKVPIFDNVINDRTGSKATNPKNEKFASYEAGLNFWSNNGKFMAKVNFYYTTWKDRANSRNVTNADGTEGLIFITGMNSLHEGLEIETAFQPNRFFRFDGSASIANWKYTDDVKGIYKDYSAGDAQDVEYNFYVKDLKVGDAPQTQFALAGTVYPVTGFQTRVEVRHYRDHYSNWDPFSRTNPEDRVQGWKVPNYTVVDLHAQYYLPFNFGRFRPQIFLHVFNLLDETYIQDSTDNSRFNAWDKDHDADDAEVFFGLPRFWNLGLKLDF
ncbi:MAG: TonB-dependent receptor, partial [Calditrichaeota bacterium]